MAGRYVGLLGDGDLAVLGRYGAIAEADAARWFRADPGRVDAALASDAVYDGLLGGGGGRDIEVVSPVLVFAVVVHRGAAEVAERSHVPERFGSRLVVPVFDGERLARFAGRPEARSFLVELLGSYTRVASGPRWERTHGRWRRRRFSEMDPAQLAQLATSLPPEDRAGPYRRLGDLALFLNGVFPDHAARHTLSPIDLARILRSVPGSTRDELARLLDAERIDAMGPVLAALGPHWYRLAARLVPVPAMRDELEAAAEDFDLARRFLHFVTDRHLWNRRDGMFAWS